MPIRHDDGDGGLAHTWRVRGGPAGRLGSVFGHGGLTHTVRGHGGIPALVGPPWSWWPVWRAMRFRMPQRSRAHACVWRGDAQRNGWRCGGDACAAWGMRRRRCRASSTAASRHPAPHAHARTHTLARAHAAMLQRYPARPGARPGCYSARRSKKTLAIMRATLARDRGLICGWAIGHGRVANMLETERARRVASAFGCGGMGRLSRAGRMVERGHSLDHGSFEPLWHGVAGAGGQGLV